MPTRQKILLVVLGIVVIIFVYMTYFSGSTSTIDQSNPLIGEPPTAQAQQNAAQVQQNAVQARSAVPGNNKSTEVQTKPAAVFEGNWGPRDPFYRQVIKKVETVIEESRQELNLILSGVQRVRGETIAVINNNIYREGDVVEGKKIVTIEKDYVVLRDNNNEYILKLGGKNE